MNTEPPNGISELTVDRVIDVVRRAIDGEVSAADTAGSTGMSVVTARRYLRYLTQIGTLRVSCRYGKVGAPERVYRLAPEADLAGARSAEASMSRSPG